MGNGEGAVVPGCSSSSGSTGGGSGAETCNEMGGTPCQGACCSYDETCTSTGCTCPEETTFCDASVTGGGRCCGFAEICGPGGCY
jgi:hypothetical protein